jgi:hypothetical protein
MPATIFPTIHLNGTSKRELLDNLCAAYAAIEHRARQEALAEIEADLLAIAEHIDA